MSQIDVGKGDNLQLALDQSKPGDEVVLDANERFIGNFVLPPKAGKVLVTSSINLPERRVTPDDAILMPTLACENADPVILCNHSSNWILQSIRFEGNPNGLFDAIHFQDANEVTLDRILLIIPDGKTQKRGILGNGTNISLTRSHLGGVNMPGQDSQCFCAWDGAGPYTITDNFLEAASENVMFGGAGALSPDRIPADILIENNYFFKPLSWVGKSKGVKNLFELKTAKRVKIRNNIFENCWEDAQSGFAIVFTVRNDNADAPWSVVEDVLFEKNIIKNVDRGVNILGYNDGSPSEQGTRIVIRDNNFQTNKQFLQMGGRAGIVRIENNIVQNGHWAMNLYSGWIWPNGQQPQDAVWACQTLYNLNNQYANPAIFGDGMGEGQPAIDRYIEHYNPEQPPIEPPIEPPVEPPVSSIPTVSISSVNRKGNSNNYAVVAEASVETTHVEFLVNGNLQATLTVRPYKANVKAQTNELLTVRAYNLDGKFGEDTWEL